MYQLLRDKGSNKFLIIKSHFPVFVLSQTVYIYIYIYIYIFFFFFYSIT